MSTTDELEIGDLLTAAPLDGLDVEMVVADDSEHIEVPPITVLTQNDDVLLYDVNCATGATTKFAIPITAWGWKTRLGYFRANGTRIGLGPTFEWNRSFYPGSNPSVRFRGTLPPGTKDLRAFWWYDGGQTWWNKKVINC
ncbi:hypothetical protein ACFYYS_20060 [Streptomyces sp. NPDC002120]|uniref:hypothetical protein n=1 Tax=Streptomyces sp. NPDC002120 TaxID=3364631 RepID=UPI00368ED736